MVALLILTLAVAGCVAAAAYSAWSLHREAHGREIHAHDDGTVHSHHRGSRHHVHPTFVERYDARLARWFGASPRARRTIDLSAAPDTRTSEV
jgi:hypothetical protein